MGGLIMAKYEKAIVGEFEEVVNQLQKDISNSGISMISKRF